MDYQKAPNRHRKVSEKITGRHQTDTEKTTGRHQTDTEKYPKRLPEGTKQTPKRVPEGNKETPKRKPKSEAEIKKITSSDAYKKADYKGKTKMLGGQVFTRKEMEEKIKKKKQGIKEKILPQKKQNRLNELRKELGMNKGGKVKKKFPDLTGDGKVTKADILKGRGVFRKGGASK